MVIQRNIYLNELVGKKHNGLIKVVTGVRRCGKSYLLFHLFKEHLLSTGLDKNHIIEIAFDAFENKNLQDTYYNAYNPGLHFGVFLCLKQKKENRIY